MKPCPYLAAASLIGIPKKEKAILHHDALRCSSSISYTTTTIYESLLSSHAHPLGAGAANMSLQILSRCALLPPFPFFHSTMIAKQVNTEKHRSASHRMPEVEFIDRARRACLGRASRTACAHGTMRVKRLGISKSAYGPGVLPILAAAPAPSR